MRIAYVRIPNFEIGVERERGSAPARAPVVLGGSAHDRSPVRRASPEAVAEGVQEGMPLREAAARCPAATFLPYDDRAYEEAAARVLHVLREYTDIVEPDGYGATYLDASGWGSLAGSLRMARNLAREVSRGSLEASIGIAPTRFTARIAALHTGR
ncbi:MAG: DNA polymerase IV, partial [Chloroflexota bacterium]|nr:DNA polymerase IV [Chloroflexota bacterium]